MRVFCVCLGFGAGPFSNHHHSPLDMSKTWGPCGRLQRWVIALRDAFSCCTETWCSLQKEYTIHLAVVSYMPPTPLGVGNIVKTECNLQVIYTSIVWFVFLTNISNVLSFLQGFAGALWPLHIEWISNFKGCWKRSHGDPMSRLGLWLGTNKATVASTSDRWHEPNNNSSPVELLWQRTAAQPSQHPRRHKHVNVRMIAQHRCQRQGGWS